jgi:hypothetical protein
VAIQAAAVRQVASVQRIDLRAARDLVIRDALLENGALESGLGDSVDSRLAIRGHLARSLLRHLLVEARRIPPTDAELANAAQRKWFDVDRPEGSLVVHAVVRLADHDNSDDATRGLALARAIHSAAQSIAARASEYPPSAVPASVQPASIAQPQDPLAVAFRHAVEAVPHDEFNVTIESLQPVAADGRILAAGGNAYYDQGFAQAAAALPARGALSDIVRTPFGAHVILLLARTPAQMLTGQERYARLRDDVVNERARAEAKKLLLGLRPRSAIAPDAPGLLDLASVEQ